MKITVAYVYPAIQPATYRPLARRFVDSYMKFPPGGSDHNMVALINGGVAGMEKNYRTALHPIEFQHFYHNNVGKDIGAFQAFADGCNSDLLVCLGAPVRCRRAGWLDRIVQSYEYYGPGLYGGWGFHEPVSHIRTTAFWLPPQLLKAYPFQVVNESRYEFEHGQRSIHNFVKSIGLGSYMVTWSGCFQEKDWHHVGLSDCLFLDQHTDRIGF